MESGHEHQCTWPCAGREDEHPRGLRRVEVQTRGLQRMVSEDV